MNTWKKRWGVALVLCGCLFLMPTLLTAESGGTDTVSKAEVKKELRDAAEAIRQYAAAQRQEALKKAEELLKDLDRRIEELERNMDDQWATMSAAARSNARETLKALRQHRNEVAEWYGGLKHSSDGAWEHMKKGFSDAYADLGEAWQNAREEFAKDK